MSRRVTPEELRERALHCDNYGDACGERPVGTTWEGDLLRRAADTIEALEAERDNLRHCILCGAAEGVVELEDVCPGCIYDGDDPSYQQLVAERDRLRKVSENLLWMAARYAHGRSTYAPSIIRQAVAEMQSLLPDWEPRPDATIEPPPAELGVASLESDFLHDLFGITVWAEAEASVTLDAPTGIHTCYEGCPCREGREANPRGGA